MKGTLARLGIRNFKPTLRQAAERLATLHTPESTPVPPNALVELQRDVARLGFVVGQIKQIEKARQKRLEQPESESDIRRANTSVPASMNKAAPLSLSHEPKEARRHQLAPNHRTP